MENFKADAQTMTAAFDTLAAVVMSITPTMSAEQKALFASNLARLAKNAEKQGWTVLETALLDMYRAAIL